MTAVIVVGYAILASAVAVLDRWVVAPRKGDWVTTVLITVLWPISLISLVSELSLSESLGEILGEIDGPMRQRTSPARAALSESPVAEDVLNTHDEERTTSDGEP